MSNTFDYRSQYPFLDTRQLIHMAWADELGGVLSANIINFPPPGHNPWDRSGSVLILSWEDPGYGEHMGFIVYLRSPHDNTQAATNAARDHVAAAKLRAVEKVNGGVYVPLAASMCKYSAEPIPMPSWIWEKLRCPVIGSPIPLYLASRRLEIPIGHVEFMKYDDGACYKHYPDHHELRHGEPEEQLIYAPAMALLMRFIDTNAIANRQNTFLNDDGTKLLENGKTVRRYYKGAPTKNVAVKLGYPKAGELIVGEGFEGDGDDDEAPKSKKGKDKSASKLVIGSPDTKRPIDTNEAVHLGPKEMYQLEGYQRSVWSVGSANNIAMLPVIEGVNRLILLGENDAKGQSKTACDRCAERWRLYDRKVSIKYPPQGCKDWNDYLVGAVK